MSLANDRARFTGSIVTIQVGGDHSTRFSVHEPIIKADSEFFKLALDKKWREGQELAVQLPEDDLDTFAAYVEWLYARQTTVATFGELAGMYVLGNKIQSPDFCKAIISKMVGLANTQKGTPDVEVINTIFEGTPTKSAARRLMVEMWRLNGSTLAKLGQEYHSDFVMDLAQALLAPNIGKEYRRVGKDAFLGD